MKLSHLAPFLLIALAVSGQPGPSFASPADASLHAASILIGNLEDRERAIDSLRHLGPAGMDALLQAADGDERFIDRDSPHSLALDRVCGVRDCIVSRLFWHTDLDDALAEAERLNRPVLSLRLLGRLDEDLSCANSRFFRTALYPDTDVGQLLRDQFVLHWHTVRPVPKVTIDYGNGRSLRGTITGNSVHYVLDRQGRLTDALPGLYGPKVFSRELTAAGKSARRAGRFGDAEFLLWARDHHRASVRRLDTALRKDLEGTHPPETYTTLRDELDTFAKVTASQKPTAREAARLATSKSVWQVGVLSALTGIAGTAGDLPGEELWPILATVRSKQASLDARSRGLFRALHNSTDPFTELEARKTFQETMALDTVRNQYLLRRSLHVWLGERESGLSPETFDQRVYADLFRTPLSDPWLGLAPTDIFSGLEVASVTDGEAH